jgi:hypothetical protein
MIVYEVVPKTVYVHPEKDYQVSIYGAHPGEGWEAKERGFTVYNKQTGTYGACRVPWSTREDAQKWADGENERLRNIRKAFINSSVS